MWLSTSYVTWFIPTTTKDSTGWWRASLQIGETGRNDWSCLVLNRNKIKFIIGGQTFSIESLKLYPNANNLHDLEISWLLYFAACLFARNAPACWSFAIAPGVMRAGQTPPMRLRWYLPARLINPDMWLITCYPKILDSIKHYRSDPTPNLSLKVVFFFNPPTKLVVFCNVSERQWDV